MAIELVAGETYTKDISLTRLECVEGETRCEPSTFNHQICFQNKWVIDVFNDPRCGYEPPVSDIILENLRVVPTEVYVGDTVSITVTARNIGEATGSRTVSCDVSYLGVVSKTVTLGSGQSTEVIFSVTPTVAATHEVKVDGLGKLFYVISIPIELTLELSASNLNPSVGEKVSFYINVANIGDTAGDWHVKVYVDSMYLGGARGWLEPNYQTSTLLNFGQNRFSPECENYRAIEQYTGVEDRIIVCWS